VAPGIKFEKRKRAWTARRRGLLWGLVAARLRLAGWLWLNERWRCGSAGVEVPGPRDQSKTVAKANRCRQEQYQMRSTAAERRARHFAEHKHERKQEDQARRDQVIAEFGGDPNAMADEILRYRRGVAQLEEAIGWARQGAPFTVIAPGPYWNARPMTASIARPSDWTEK
jgi:hypothetical protein